LASNADRKAGEPSRWARRPERAKTALFDAVSAYKCYSSRGSRIHPPRSHLDDPPVEPTAFLASGASFHAPGRVAANCDEKGSEIGFVDVETVVVDADGLFAAGPKLPFYLLRVVGCELANTPIEVNSGKAGLVVFEDLKQPDGFDPLLLAASGSEHGGRQVEHIAGGKIGSSYYPEYRDR